MVEVDVQFVLALLTIVVFTAVLMAAVPRVDEMATGYRQFVALTALGIGYLVVAAALLTVLSGSGPMGPVETVLGLAAAAIVVIGVTVLVDVFDDWLRLFADPTYNTWVELAMVAGVVVLLLVIFWTTTV